MPRDLTIPWTEAELEEARIGLERIPSLTDGCFPSTDIPLILKTLDLERTPEQMDAYKGYWDKHFSGRIPLNEVINLLSTLHDNAKCALGRAKFIDKDGNGFISKDEFEELMKMMITHDQKLKNIPYEEFVKAADTNKDGVVSLKECAIWMEQHMGNG